MLSLSLKIKSAAIDGGLGGAESEDEALIPPSQTASNSVLTPPSSLEETEALLDIIPLKQSDYHPLLRLSPWFHS